MRRRDDSGLTLVELTVSSLILSIVLLAVGSMMVGILSAQARVSASTQTATAAQNAANQIATGVRNASDVRLTAPAGSDQLLVVRSANTGGALTWSCRAWYYSATNGAIRTKVTSGTPITAPTSTQLESWTVLVSDVAPRAGDTAIFSVVAGGIAIAYDAETSDGPPVAIDTTAVKRTGVAEAGTCY